VKSPAHLLGGNNAVHGPLEADVHKDQVRLSGFSQGQGLLPAGGCTSELVAHGGQPVLDVHRDDGFIFND
jgi:hypothetical protein